MESEEEKKEIFIPNINTIIIDCIEVSLSCYLLNELEKCKVNLIICDEKHNPSSQLQSIYGCFDCSGKINNQINWKEYKRKKIWTLIIKNKINCQNDCLEIIGLDKIIDIEKYINKITYGDPLNIEGTIAKIYFHKLFGLDFNRRVENNINIMLNYGYSILLSLFNREIISNGYLTQIGLHHFNKANPYNLSSDLMEPFRPYIDRIVYSNKECSLDRDMKYKLINTLYCECEYKGKKMLVINAIPVYIKDVFDSLQGNIITIKEIKYV